MQCQKDDGDKLKYTLELSLFSVFRDSEYQDLSADEPILCFVLFGVSLYCDCGGHNT